MTNLKQIVSGAKLGSRFNPLERLDIGRPGDPPFLILWNGRIFTYNREGQALIDGGIVTALGIASNIVTAEKLFSGGKKFVHNILFTPTDYDTVSWSTGRLVKADGTAVITNAGSTGNITQKTYIYFNGTATLQTTTSYLIAVGGNNIPLAIAEPDIDTDGKAIIASFVTSDTTISGDTLSTGRIQSRDGNTYFDLNGDQLVVHDGSHVRVVLGKIVEGVYGIKISLQGYDAIDDQNINHFALWATSSDTEDHVLIKESERGTASVLTGFANRLQLSHGLGYIPMCFVFYEESTGVWRKLVGSNGEFSPAYYEINSTHLILVNVSGSTKNFAYYIFYDEI